MKRKGKYLLCITIPTYNRRKYLDILLKSIVTQEGFSDKVSIMINDGPSNDQTTEMVLEYQKKYNNIFYEKNKKAVGMLPAILESIDMSNGEYTWLFGSDDSMAQNALSIVISKINNSQPTLILMNREIINNNEILSDNGSPIILKDFMGFSDFGSYIGTPESQKFDDKLNYFTFMSIFCFNTEYYKSSIKYITNNNICTLDALQKHYFNYIVILFAELYSKNIISIIESPRLVYCLGGNNGWIPNKKINQDLEMLISYVVNTYPLSNNCLSVLKKMKRVGYLFGTWVYQAQKIPIIGSIIRKISANKKIKQIYVNFINKIV